MRSHQIAKHNPHFRLQQQILKKRLLVKTGKGKGIRRQKNIHITYRFTKFLVLVSINRPVGARGAHATSSAVARPKKASGP